MISQNPEGYLLGQKVYSNKKKTLPVDHGFYLFKATRHRLAWTTQASPEISACINIVSQVTKETYGKEGTKIIIGEIKQLENIVNQN